MGRESYVFYESFWKALENLNAEDVKECLKAISEYALYGKEPDISGIAMTVFVLVKPQIDANNKRYENGKKGGRPKANNNQDETKAKPNNNQNETKSEPNVNVNDNDNVNVNDNTYGCFGNVFLTDEEYESLKAEFTNFKGRIDALSEYMESTGRKYKNHYATIKAWARKEPKEIKPKLHKAFKEEYYERDDFKAEQMPKEVRQRLNTIGKVI